MFRDYLSQKNAAKASLTLTDLTGDSLIDKDKYLILTLTKYDPDTGVEILKEYPFTIESITTQRDFLQSQLDGINAVLDEIAMEQSKIEAEKI
jgi:hypothetical protein